MFAFRIHLSYSDIARVPMIISATAVTFLFLVALFVAVFRGMISRPAIANDAVGWIETFSLDAYAPMKRLLNEDDFEYLASLPGYTPCIARALRRERKAVYLAYVSRLVNDFRCLFAIAKAMVVYGEKDRSDFAASLWRQEINFYAAIVLIRLRLALYPALSGSWDLQSVLQPLQILHNNIHQQAVEA